MRYGNCGGQVYLPVYGGALAHNAEFLPHWKEFANALEEQQHALKCLPKERDTNLTIVDVDFSA